MTHRALTLVLLCGLPACDTESSDDDDGGLCEALDCSGHGTCRNDAQDRPYCDCDDGYEAQGFDCVPAGDQAPEPPEELSCPAPGAAGDPLLVKLTATPWYYVMNDRTCDLNGWRLIYTFRADGVFSIKSQFRAAAGTNTGTFDYGCFGVATADEVLTLSYDYSNDSSRNCTMLGGLRDPPCTADLGPSGDDFVLAATLASAQETHLLRPVTDPACVFCASAATCCPEPGWVSDASGEICP